VESCRLNRIKFIDCQVESTHLSQFGAIQISRREYLKILHEATKNQYL
jgi:Leu/Phe-tRNA-protein transferase